MRWDLFWRYTLDFSIIYPGAALCYLPVFSCLKPPRWRRMAAVFGGITGLVLACSLVCTLLHICSNRLLPPVLLVSFLVYRYMLPGNFSMGKLAYVFGTMTSLMGACTVLTCLIMARVEVANEEPVCLPVTSLICLGLSLLMVLLFIPLMRPRIVWLVEEFHASRVWRIAWMLPASFTLMYCLMQPWDPATVLVKRVQEMGVVLVVASLLVLQFLTFLFYRIARELTANTRLAEENQVLTIEARRYQALRAHVEETRLMRHDFRQHLRVISNLTDAGRMEELKQYLRQYEQELGGEHVSVCENAAVDAIAGYYHHYAVTHETPVDWKISLPEALPLPATDLCMLLGNLLENALRASVSLPAEQRSIHVICQMLSPAMLGLIVENAYDGALKKDGNTFRSTHPGGTGAGLQSVENIVRRYHGKLTIETENQVFSVNVLLNL